VFRSTFPRPDLGPRSFESHPPQAPIAVLALTWQVRSGLDYGARNPCEPLRRVPAHERLRGLSSHYSASRRRTPVRPKSEPRPLAPLTCTSRLDLRAPCFGRQEPPRGPRPPRPPDGVAITTPVVVSDPVRGAPDRSRMRFESRITFPGLDRDEEGSRPRRGALALSGSRAVPRTTGERRTNWKRSGGFAMCGGR